MATNALLDLSALNAVSSYEPNELIITVQAGVPLADVKSLIDAKNQQFAFDPMYISGEFGRQWLGTSDAFYGNGLIVPSFAAGIPEPSYNTWNIGVGFTYKVFTLDIRYTDTNLSKASCNAFTSDFSTTNASPGFVTAINPGTGATALGSNWCSATGIVKLSADLTAMSNLK